MATPTAAAAAISVVRRVVRRVSDFTVIGILQLVTKYATRALGQGRRVNAPNVQFTRCDCPSTGGCPYIADKPGPGGDLGRRDGEAPMITRHARRASGRP